MNPSDLHRQSPNALHLGDVVEAIVTDGQPFIGRIVDLWTGSIWLENGMGGRHMAHISDVIR